MTLTPDTVRAIDALLVAMHPGAGPHHWQPAFDIIRGRIASAIDEGATDAPARLALIEVAEEVDEGFMFIEGDQVVSPPRSRMKGIAIAHRCFQHANDPRRGPLVPEDFCPGVSPDNAVRNALRNAAAWVEEGVGMRWLASAILKCRVKATNGQSLVAYEGDRIVRTSRNGIF